MQWLRRKQKPGLVGVGFHAAGATLAWLQPSPSSGHPVLTAQVALRGTSLNDLAAPIQQWVDRHGAKGARCVAVMESGSYQLLQVEPPQVPEEELRTALKWRVRDLVAYPVEQALLDLFEPPAPVRNRVRHLNVVVARESLVCERIRLLEQAGLQLDALDIGQLVQRNIAARLPHNEPGLALLSLDEDNGLITLVRRSEVYLARELDFGLDALPIETDNGAEDPAYERITLELQRSLDYFESALSQPPLTRIVVFPGGERTAGLLAYLKRNFFQQQIHELALDDVIESPAEAELEFASQPACLFAIGAALRSIEAAP